MRSERWDKVTLTWNFRPDCGIGTSVRLDGIFDPTAYDPRVFSHEADKRIHGLGSMEASSLPHDQEDYRQGEMILDIRRKAGPNVPPKSKEIVQLLEAQMVRLTIDGLRLKCQPRVEPPPYECWTQTKFKILYALGNGEQFCDTTIELARAVFTALGVHDVSGHWLSHFTLKRETFVRLDGGWITFPHWLRMQHRLPILGPEDNAI